MFKKTLIIDNDTRFSHGLGLCIEGVINTQTTLIKDLSHKVEDSSAYDLYIVRLDDRTDETIKFLSNEDKFVIIMTKQDTEKTRDKILSYSVTDYVITNSMVSKNHICEIAQRLESNSTKTVLCVDDSKVVLSQISMLLESQNLNFIQFSDAREALKHINDPESKKIDLVITDYEMPFMDGYEFTKKVREKNSLEELPLLVVSGSEDTYMISRFLKVGANDYIPKPFIKEEFLGRVKNALSLGGMFQEIKNMAMTDHLTGLHNRVYFYDTGSKVYDMTKRAGNQVAIAMVDIDNFKIINDTYGHEIGDRALIHVAHTMKKSLRNSDIIVRFGGEEFVMLLPNCTHDEALKVMEKVCSAVANAPLFIEENKELNITVSIGVSPMLENIDDMVEKADKFMYVAKKSGKNRVYTDI
jgi:diguanylate cyclase (GGDEF)-like protein